MLEKKMRQFKFSKETSTIALVFFTVYFFYGLFRLPFVQFLVSVGTGAIAYGIFESYEAAVIVLLAMNFFYPLFAEPSNRVRGSVSATEGFMGNATPTEVTARIQSIMNRKAGGDVQGVGSPMTEGFADAAGATGEAAAAAPPAVTTTATVPAAPAAPAASPVPTNTPATNNTNTTTNNAPVPTNTQGFRDNSGLFKLGEIPADAKGGFHIDAGSTVINALNALKPDQIAAMTQDTKQLIETQKSLMNMLQTFSPMVQEGKQMMDTFQQMFSPSAGSATGSLQTAQNLLLNKPA
jgi:hypothetical protein